MARLRDVPHVFRTVGAFAFAKRVYQQISEDLVFTWAAALAYSWMFAIFPFFIFVLTLAPYLPYGTKDTVMHEIDQALSRTLPAEAAKTLQENIVDVMSRPRGGLLSVGLVFAIWAASGGMAVTMQAMDITYDIDKRRSYFKQRAWAILLTIVCAVMILLVIILLPVGTIVLQFIADHLDVLSAPILYLLNITRYVAAITLLFGVIALIYHFGPSIRARFRAITPGAVFVVGMWLLLGFAFRFYINNFARYDQMYGTVGGVAILLMLFYLDAVVLLAGAEINSEIDFIVMGLPSTADQKPEEAAATAAPLDEEQEELKRELEEKRRDDLSESPIAPPKPSTETNASET